ncbi:MAG: SpoIIE family protein phosphatase [Terriglobales bacterium]
MSGLSATSPAPLSTAVPALLYVDGAEQRTIQMERLPFTIGRKTDRDLVIADSRVSREHAQIVCENGDYYLVDLNSRHGTFVNGVRRERHKLVPNDRIDFGARDAAYAIFAPDRPSSSAAEFLSQISMLPATAGSTDLEKLRLFLEAARKLNTTGLLSDVLVTLLDSTLKLTKAERGYVFLRGTDGKMQMAAGRNAKGEQLMDDTGISKSILEEAASAASEFMVSDTSSSSDLAARNSIIAYDLRTVIAIPLRRTQTQLQEKAVTKEADAHPQVRGVLYLDSRFASRDISAVSHDILRAIAHEAAALVENAHLVQAEEANRRYQQELAIAGTIQQRLMTVTIPDVPFAAIRATNLACKDVGGDFFDVVTTDQGLNVLVADVSGKGITAALLASILQGMIYAQLVANMPLAEIVTTANTFLCRKVMGQKYATLLLCRLKPDGELEYVNCGHVPPVLIAGGTAIRPKDCNLPVGLLAAAEFESATLKLPPGGRFVMVTDGVTEAEDATGEFFGDSRLEQAANSDHPFDSIFAGVKSFCGETPLNDDCTILELAYKG